MIEYKTSHLPPDDIVSLWREAFKTNDDSDVLAYYKAVSAYFQDRHIRAINRELYTQAVISEKDREIEYMRRELGQAKDFIAGIGRNISAFEKEVGK